MDVTGLNEAEIKSIMGAVRESWNRTFEQRCSWAVAEVLTKIVRSDFNVRPVLVHVKPLTVPICLACLKQCGEALNLVPLNLRTREVCLEAVQNNGMALKMVPRRIRTREVCIAAVRSDPRALLDVPDSLKDLEMCWTALERNPSMVYHVPKRILDQVEAAIGPVPRSIGRAERLARILRQVEDATGLIPRWAENARKARDQGQP